MVEERTVNEAEASFPADAATRNPKSEGVEPVIEQNEIQKPSLEWNADAHLPFFRVTPVEEFRDRPPREWLIDDLIGLGDLVVIYGESGVYKSFLALDWAISIDVGLDWKGRPVKQGKVLYVAAEGADGLPDRLQAWEQHHGRKAEGMGFLYGEVPCLTHEADTRQFLQRIESDKPALIIIDTLTACFGGKEQNESGPMGHFVSALQEAKRLSGGSVLVIHHANKNTSTYRGSAVLKNAADVMMKAKRDGRKGLLTITSEKARDASPFPPLSLKPLELSLPDGRSSLVLVGKKEPMKSRQAEKGGQKLSKNEQKALSVLQQAFPDSLALEEWRKRSEKMGVNRKTFYGLYDGKLIAKGLVERVEGEGKKLRAVSKSQESQT